MARKKTKAKSPRAKNPAKGLRKQLRQQRRAANITARQERKGNRQMANIKAKEAKQQARIGARSQRQVSKVAVKNAKKLEKIYGEMQPEEVQALNDIMPYVPTMADQLADNHIPFNEDDPIEVAATWEQWNPEIDEPFSDDDFMDAYVMDDYGDPYDENFINFKQGFKKVLPSIANGLNTYIKMTEGDIRQGKPVSEADKKLVQTAKEVETVGKEVAKDYASKKITKYLPYALVGIIIVLLFNRG